MKKNNKNDINMYTILKTLKDESKVSIITNLVDSVKRNYLISTILSEQLITATELAKDLKIYITKEDYEYIEKEFDYIVEKSSKVVNPYNSAYDADDNYIDYLLKLNNRINTYNNYMNSLYNLIMLSFNPEVYSNKELWNDLENNHNNLCNYIHSNNDMINALNDNAEIVKNIPEHDFSSVKHIK